MLRWLRRLFAKPAPRVEVVLQPPNDLFPWAAGARVTAVDEEVVIALPKELVAADEPLGDAIELPNEAEVGIPPQGEVFFIKLQAGMTAGLRRGCHAYLETNDPSDARPRKLRWETPAS